MSDEINQKVINIFSKHIKDKTANSKSEDKKSFAGYRFFCARAQHIRIYRKKRRRKNHHYESNSRTFESR